MLSRQQLFWHRDPYDLPGSDGLFLRAVRDNCTYHMAHCPAYRSLAQALSFSPDQLSTMDDLARVPLLPTLFYKRRALFSMPERRMALRVPQSASAAQAPSMAAARSSGGSCVRRRPIRLRSHGENPCPQSVRPAVQESCIWQWALMMPGMLSA